MTIIDEDVLAKKTIDVLRVIQELDDFAQLMILDIARKIVIVNIDDNAVSF